jgi:hemerythrin-like metal-binding protein
MFWKDNMATGVAELDEKLETLVENVNAMVRKMNASRNPSLMVKNIRELKDVFIEYFSYQETMMTISNYPQYYQHKHSHEILFDKLDMVANEYMAGSYGYNTTQLENTINEWFIKHIFMDDKTFADFYKKQKKL